ncbi:hypothetical protein H2203_001419 [Taxawa tesnikishii (nom. ined.)]|nr:hypothetical protein H2203_001419 [Dothideales sp. JES 119]
MPPNSAVSYLPSYYTSNDSRTPVAKQMSLESGEARVGETFISRKPLPNPKPRRQSSASDTSFESVDPEEPTPPEEEDKQLSPVAESPISGLRYPKVPRSSNQAVPRSPPTTFSLQPLRPKTPERKQSTTLVAKRRGANAAQDLERRLYIHNSSCGGSFDSTSSTVVVPSSRLAQQRTRSKHESPLRGYGKGVGAQYGTPKMQEMELKSPLWEPKLTPSRRGDDLFISVC